MALNCHAFDEYKNKHVGFIRTRLRYVRVFAIANLSVCLSSVTFMRPTPTQGIEIFGNISSPLCTLSII